MISKSDLKEGLEGALMGALGGAVLGGGAGVGYNEYEVTFDHITGFYSSLYIFVFFCFI